MAREVFNYQSASDYYRDAGEEAQLKAMKDCGLIDDDTDPEDIIYYSRTPKFDPYERNQHSDYGFTYDDPDDGRITFPNGETFDILDVAGDDSFWDQYEQIIQERNIERISENIENTERSIDMDDNMKKLMQASANMFNQKSAELSASSPNIGPAVDRSSVSGRRTIIANIEAEIKAKNPALAYNTIDKAKANGKPRPAGVDIVRVQAENIFNEGFNSLAEYEMAKGGPGSVISIADNGRAIPVGQNSAIVPGVGGTGTAIIPNAQVVDGNITAARKPVDLSSDIQPTQSTITPGLKPLTPGINAGLGTGVPANIKERLAPSLDINTYKQNIKNQQVNTNSTPAWVTESNNNAAANISAEAANIQNTPPVMQPQIPIQQMPTQEQPAVQQPGKVEITEENIPFIDPNIREQWDRESIKDVDSQIDLLKKNGYITEVQNKKVFKGIDVNKLVEARKELDTPRLATARMSYRKLERDLAICVLDSGIPEDKIDILMELFNAIGVGESFALAVEQVAYERSNSNIPMRGRLEAKYNPLDIYGQVTKHSERTEPVLTQEANRIMDVYKNDAFAFASIKKSQVLDVLEFINKNGLFVNFTVDEARSAYSELASSCLYDRFDKRSYENWKTIIYYVVGILGCQDTLLREYYISTFGDTPENDTKLGGNNMNNNTLRPSFGMGTIASIPGMINQPTQVTAQPNGTTVQNTPVAPGQAGTIQQPVQNVATQVQPGAGMVQAPTNPMMGSTVAQPTQVQPQPVVMPTQTVVTPQVNTTPVAPAPVQPTGPINMPAMAIAQTQAQPYGGAQPTVPAQTPTMVGQQPTMVNQNAGAIQMQPNVAQPTQVQPQPMVIAPTQPVVQSQYTQPVVAQPTAQYVQPAPSNQNQMMNQNINGGMNMNMMNGYNQYNQFGYNQYGMPINQQVMPMAPTQPTAMNPMMGNAYTQQNQIVKPMAPTVPTMPGQMPMTQQNPMMNGYNQFNQFGYNLYGMPQTTPMPTVPAVMNPTPMATTPVVPAMNPTVPAQMPVMPNQFNARTPMANTTPMATQQMMYQNPMARTNPMMGTAMSNPMGMPTNPMMNGMNMMGQQYTNPMNPMMTQQYGMAQQNPMMNGYNQYNQFGYNQYGMPINQQVMPMAPTQPTAMNPMMSKPAVPGQMVNNFGYNQYGMPINQQNPMMGAAYTQPQMYNGGMNMMNSMYQPNPNNMMGQNTFGYNQYGMPGYGYNGYGMNGMGF